MSKKMTHRLKKTVILSLVVALMIVLASCSGSDEDEREQSGLEKKQHEIAEETKEMIIVPIEKARMAQGIVDERNQKTLEELEKE